MIPIETIAIFLTASAALALAPGPDNIFVLTQSALYGYKAGFIITLGLCTGLIAHTSAVSLGLAVIFQTSSLAFNSLKIVGAIYLIFLAWQSFRSGSTDFDKTDNIKIKWDTLFYRGVIMNITNPKVAIFFLAFLPQFVDPAKGAISTQIMMLGGLFIVTTLLIFSSIAWFSALLGEWLKKSKKAPIIMSRIAGIVFISLALKLVISEK